jgi:hypothetical protein
MVILIHDPPNEALITELFAYLSTDATGEGICSTIMDGVAIPMITARRRIAEKMKPRAEAMERMSGKLVKMVRFVRVEE